MARLRRALRRIAVTWLLCQAATVTLAPTVFWFAAADKLLECTCTHGDHTICPMHHKSAAGSKICLMRSADDSGVTVLSWLLSVGPMPTPTEVLIPERLHLSRPVDVTTALLRPSRPDPPPPRA